VLVPDMSYENFRIYNGNCAQVSFLPMAKGGIQEEEPADLEEGIFTCCGQDTLAIVKLQEPLARQV
jgi:hypothetical protein